MDGLKVFCALSLLFSATQALAIDVVIPPKSSQEDYSKRRTLSQKAFDTSNDLEIANAKCKTQIVPSTEDLIHELSSSKSLFDHALQAFDIPQKKLSGKCKTSLCQILNVFGKDAGYRMIFLFQLGFNTSPYIANDARAWNASELNQIVATVLDLPRQKFRFDDKALTRFPNGYTLAMYGQDNAVVANASITIFDLWDTLPAEEKQYTIFHEIAHNIDDELSIEVQTNENASVWNNKTTTSEYGDSNRAEDIAESISAYRYSPGYLKNVSQKKYEWIRSRVFKGMEFNTEAECSGQRDEVLQKLSHELSLAMRKKFSLPESVRYQDLKMSEADLAAAQMNCFGYFYSDALGPFHACLEAQAKAWVSKNTKIEGQIDFTNAWGDARRIQKANAPDALQSYSLINVMIARAATEQDQAVASLKSKENLRWVAFRELLNQNFTLLEQAKQAKLAEIFPWVKCASDAAAGLASMKVQSNLIQLRVAPLSVFKSISKIEDLSNFEQFKNAMAEPLLKNSSKGLTYYCSESVASKYYASPANVQAHFLKQAQARVEEEVKKNLARSEAGLSEVYQALMAEMKTVFYQVKHTPGLKVVGTQSGAIDLAACSRLFSDDGQVAFCRLYLAPSVGKKQGEWTVDRSKLKLEALFH